ncbi:hypothetical protein [Tateyamaria sp.]|uniref:hypothetical protein n=1 Tax=Tateyamaria sp. TaxID=1929288 RepID=UPI0032A144A3
MSKEMGGVLVFGALVMFVVEQCGVAERKAARGGREIGVSTLVAFASAAGERKRRIE